MVVATLRLAEVGVIHRNGLAVLPDVMRVLASIRHGVHCHACRHPALFHGARGQDAARQQH